MFKDFNLNKFKTINYPADDSLKTLSEIKDLQSNPIDVDYSEKYNKITDVFKNLFVNRTRKYPEKIVKELLDNSRPIILKLKNYHDRRRPNVVAEDRGIKLSYHKMKSAQTPSFPSGHSTQSKLVALVLSDLYPEMRNEFMTAAEHISKSRIVARVHYESDKKIGEQLGESLFHHLKTA